MRFMKLPKLERLANIFDADYYERGIETKKSNYKDYSLERLGHQFERTAKHIVKHFNPSSLLDVGCAKGFLVYHLRQAGVDAYGIDASPYAIAGAPPQVKDFVKVGLVETVQYKEKFDVVTAFDVLEHLEEQDVLKACKRLLATTKKYVILCVPTCKVEGDLDISHNTIRTKEWWESQFVKCDGIVEPVDKCFDAKVWWFNISDFLMVVRKK